MKPNSERISIEVLIVNLHRRWAEDEQHVVIVQ